MLPLIITLALVALIDLAAPALEASRRRELAFRREMWAARDGR